MMIAEEEYGLIKADTRWLLLRYPRCWRPEDSGGSALHHHLDRWSLVINEWKDLVTS